MAIKEILEGNTSKITEATELLKVLGDREGQYVWVKCITKTISLTQITNGSNPTILQVTSNDTDLSTVDASWFVGFKGTYSLAGSAYTCEVIDNARIRIDATITNYTYNPATAQLSISMGLGLTNRVWNGMENHVVISKVISSDLDTYPNGGELDGYWYELMEDGASGVPTEAFGCTKYAVDTFTPSAQTQANQLDIYHTLGEVPNVIFVMATSTPSTTQIRYAFAARNTRGFIMTGLRDSDNNAFNLGTVTAYNNRFFPSGTYYWGGGVTYRVITMA